LLAMTLLGYVSAWWLMRRETARTGPRIQLRNPFELNTALGFGFFLALILWLTQVLRREIGEMGIYLTAALSGLTDVDAITLSLARLAQDPALLDTAAVGILLAALVNTAVKGAMAAVLGSRRLGILVGGTFALQAVLGVAVFLVWG